MKRELYYINTRNGTSKSSELITKRPITGTIILSLKQEEQE